MATVYAWKAYERKLSRVRVPPPPHEFSGKMVGDGLYWFDEY